jgi:uncharacterized protein
VVAALALSGCVGGGGDDRPAEGELARAAGRGDLEAVNILLRRGASPDDRGEGDRTAVTAAVYAGAPAVVRALVDARADVDLQDETRSNAFLAVGETGDVAVLREVLRANPDLKRTNRFGGTALIPAADRGHVEMVRALLQTGVEIDHVNDLGWTALLEAVILGDVGPAHHEIVRLLVAAGARTDLADRDGVTPLAHARSRGYDEVAELLR